MFAFNEKVTACKCDGMSKRIVNLFRPFFRLKILFASYYFFIGCHVIQNMECCRVSRIKSCLFDVCGFINNELNTFDYGRIPKYFILLIHIFVEYRYGFVIHWYHLSLIKLLTAFFTLPYVPCFFYPVSDIFKICSGMDFLFVFAK